MTPNEIREKTPQELQKLELEFREELFRLQLKRTTGQLEKNHRIKQVKRDLARLLTIAHQGKGN